MIEKCPLCEAGWKPISAPPVAIGNFNGDLGLAECLGCGVRFVNPRPSPESLSAFYNTEGYDCHDPQFGSDPNPRLKIIRQFKTSGVLCDFGAGAGLLLNAAKLLGWNVCGVEAGRSRESLQSSGFNVVTDLSEMEVAPDVFTMVHTLEHLPSPGITLLGVRRKLKDHGLLYVEVPNADSVRARLANSPLKPYWTHAPERFLAFPIHLFYFNSSSLERLLKSSGFKVIKMGTMGMGVEELFQHAPLACNSSNSSAVGREQQSERKPKLLLARKAVKQIFSSFRLGENLYAVAEKAC
jgi:hypothetical protein